MGRHASDDRNAETTLLPVAPPPWVRHPAVLGVAFVIVAALVAGAAWLVGRSGSGPVLVDRPGGWAASAGARGGSVVPSTSLDPAAPGPGDGSPSGTPLPSLTARPSGSPSRSPSTPGGAVLTAAFRQMDTWSDGYRAGYTITNQGTVPVTGWTVTVTFSGTGTWAPWDADATAGANHQVTFTAKSYNRTVPAGGSVTFGMVVSGSPPPLPVACTINGRPC